MSEPVSERTRQRRRILRAAVGAPVVLTLPSGAALAATSGVCDQNSLAIFEDEPASTFTTDSDSWMRVELQKYLIREAGTPANGRVPGFVYDDIWYAVADDLQRADPITPHNPDPDHAQGPKIQNGEFYYGLVNFDGEFGVLLLNQDDSTINPIAGASCWNSLMSTDLTSNVIN